jgi:peptide/nickel transport system substrate-binding protein
MINRLSRFTPLAVIAALFAVTVTGCSKKEVVSNATFTYASAADPQTLDPAAVSDAAGATVLANVCEGLVRFKSGTTQIEAGLAETWALSSDARTCIFALRDNVKFTMARR